MIKLESAHIEEVRGIRKLDIDFSKQTFAISGPNGSGKSGVIDAIEFGLTGDIGRLAGRGTKGLSVAEHGPHVDMTKFPDAAFVELKVFIPSLAKSATITRKISAPRKPKIVPADPDVKAALGEIADHPEITLSRREILRFILVEPAKRSDEIQAILKLEEIGQTRAALNTAQNNLQRVAKSADALVRTSREMLQRHLQISTFKAADVLAAVNVRRKALSLPEIGELSADTQLDAGVEAGSGAAFNKLSVLRDIKALNDLVPALPNTGTAEVKAILSNIATLEADPALLAALQKRSLIEKGLELVDGPDCPLCDHPWGNEDHLRKHLKQKLAKSEQSKKLQDALLKSGSELSKHLTRLRALMTPVHVSAMAEGQTDSAKVLADWATDLDGLKLSLSSVDGLLGLKDRLVTGWAASPDAIAKEVKALTAKIEAKPDQTATIQAQTFLTTAQARLSDYREAMRKNKAGMIAASESKAAYDAYCRAMEDELNALYADVETDFSKFYKFINEDEEGKFTAKLTPSEGALAFDVNFYGKGLFPPAAFHSEGHQDGMGVCLYLALMKRLFGDRFTIALLDDVVMSVDADHRRQFCKLLQTEFPDTQFVITTHDRLWAQQMRSSGLVKAKASLVFHNWTVETGPLVEASDDIWRDIADALAKGRVEAAAPALRRHLEYTSRQLANDLGANPVFRADGNYELGDLLPSVLSRMQTLLGKTADVAQSWGNTAVKDAAVSRRKALSEASGASNVEQWAVNKAVHYNEWANFGRKDFEPVVATFKKLLEAFRCDQCQSWLYVMPPRGSPEMLRCQCATVSMNLTAKPK